VSEATLPRIAARRSAGLLAGAVLVACTALAREAIADPLPLRLDYVAPASCPAAGDFLDEMQARTSLARIARPGEEAIDLEVRIARRGAASEGHLVLGRGADRVDRRITSTSCEEVVSALALVTALALDPNASLAPKPAPKPVPRPTPDPTVEEPQPPPGKPPPPPRSAPIFPPAPPASTEPGAASRAPSFPWLVGARALVDVASVPRVLFGGGAFAERPFAAWWRPSIRLGLDVSGTGGFDAGPGGVWFLKALVRVQGCGFAVRLGSQASLAPCIEIQGGVLHAEGELQGSLKYTRDTNLGWLAGGIVPRVDVDAGPVVVDLQGGPVFPAVRQSFLFATPSYPIGAVAPVTWTFSIGLGGRFP
jgi:hypothetical protein